MGVVLLIIIVVVNDGHFVFCETNGYSSHRGTNGSDPIFPEVTDIVLSLCTDAREETIGGKIFVRRQTLLI